MSIAFLLGVACGQVILGQVIQTSPSGNATSTKTVSISDPALEMVAGQVRIPEGWKFEGTVLRGAGGCESLQPRLAFRALHPDGATGVELLRSYQWSWGNNKQALQITRNQGCVVMPPMKAAEFASKIFIPRARPGARVGEISAVPESAEKLANAIGQYNRDTAAALGRKPYPKIRKSGDVAKVRIEYVLNGQPVEEYVIVSTTSVETNYTPGLNQPAPTLYECEATVAVIRSPRGQLAAFEKRAWEIFNSPQATPQWIQKQNQVAAYQAQRRNEAIVKGGQEALENINAIGGASQRRTAEMEKARHDGAENFKDYLRDERNATNPNTGATSKVSSKHNYTWVNENGRKYQTDSASDNPNGRLAGNWTLMQNK